MFSHFNLIGLATRRLSWVVLSTNYLRRCHCRWWTLVVQTTEQWNSGLAVRNRVLRKSYRTVTCYVAATGLAGWVIGLHKAMVSACPRSTAWRLVYLSALLQRLPAGCLSDCTDCSQSPAWHGETVWPNELNQWPIRTQCTIAWLPVIILLCFAHVIFIEINADKIINAFTKNFL